MKYLERAKEKFAVFPKQDELHITADATVFFERNYAEVHAKTLNDSSIESFTRASVFAAEETLQDVPKSAKKKPE